MSEAAPEAPVVASDTVPAEAVPVEASPVDETDPAKAAVLKAQGQRDLADAARREAVAAAQTAGQQVNELQKQLADVTDSRDENQRLVAENTELKAQVAAQADAASKAEKIVAAHSKLIDVYNTVTNLL